MLNIFILGVIVGCVITDLVIKHKEYPEYQFPLDMR